MNDSEISEISEGIVDTEINNLSIMEDNTKLFIVNNDKYRTEDLISLKVNDIINIAKEGNICIKNLKDKNKDDLINELLGKKLENANTTIKEKIDDANKKCLENKKKLEDKEADRLRKQLEKEKREKEKDEQNLRRKKAEEDKIARENDKKKREQYEKTKIIRKYLTNDDVENTEPIDTNDDNERKKLEDNMLYKPYFQKTFSIDEISRIKVQKRQSECINMLKTLIKYCINDFNENRDLNLSIEEKAEGDYENKYICKAIINNYKTFPYLIKDKIRLFLKEKEIVKKLKKLDIDDTNFNFDIYDEGYDLTNFTTIKDNKTNNVYDFDGDEKTLFKINQGDDINNYERKVKDKIYKAKEYYDRKAILYIYHNANTIGDLIYNKVNSRKIYKQSKEDFCNHLKNQMSMLLNSLTTTNNYQQVYFKPDNNSLNSRKYAIQPVSYQNIMRELRHTIGRNYYIDVDMRNAHFNLLKHLINSRDYIDADKCKSILDYAENRQFYIDDVVKKYPKTNKDIVKQVFLSMLYNEDLDKYDYSKCEWFKNFIREFKYLQDCIYEADEFKEHIDNTNKSIEEKIERFNKKDIRYDELDDFNIFKKDKGEDGLSNNIKGKVLSRILQEQENIVLECLVKYLDDKGIKYSSLQYDGLQLLLPNKYKEFTNKLTDFQKKLKLDDKLLYDIVKHIKEELNIDIDFHYKELDEGIELPKEYEYSYEREYIVRDYNETDIADIFIKANRHIINIDVETDDRYIKRNDVWVNKIKKFKEFNINILKNMNIYILGEKYDEILGGYYYKSGKMSNDSYDKLIKKINKYNINSKFDKMESIVKNIALRDDYGDSDFVYKLNNSTIGKLCFNDGVYFMKEKIFKKYPVPEVVSTIKLPYNFPKKTEKTIKFMNTIYNLFIGAFHDNDADLFNTSLKIHSRTIGGHFRDKYWTLEYGERNSGKGCVQLLFQKSFSCYVFELAYDRVCNNQTSSDASKDNYWLDDVRWKRFGFVSEIPPDKIGNGTFIKSFASGGDTKTSRNFGSDLQKSFIPHFALTIYCNGFPKIQPRDCFDNCNLIRTHYGFNDDKVKEGNCLYKNLVKLEGLDPKDYIIKYEEDCRDAFLWLILDKYEDNRIVRIPKMMELLEKNDEIYNQTDIVSIINEYFEKAEDSTDNRLTKNDISVFKKNLYTKGDKQLGIMKDGEILEKLTKLYDYKKQRCKGNENKPCYCFTGIKIKSEYLKYFKGGFIEDEEVTNEVLDYMIVNKNENKEIIVNEIVDNEIVDNDIVDNDINFPKYIVPKKRVSKS